MGKSTIAKIAAGALILTIGGIILLILVAPYIRYDPSYVRGIRNFFNPPSSVVKNFYFAVCDGDFEKAEKNLSASIPLQKDVMRLGLSSFLTQCKNNGGLAEVQISKQNIEAEKAAVFGAAIFNNRTSDQFGMLLYLEQGSWKISWNADVFDKSIKKSLQELH
jgi:hypothetical protein